MLANITFKAYESPNKELTSLLTEFTLEFVDTDSINTITQAIEKRMNIHALFHGLLMLTILIFKEN